MNKKIVVETFLKNITEINNQYKKRITNTKLMEKNFSSYTDSQKLFFTNQELDQIFHSSIKCIENFFNINKQEIEKFKTVFLNNSNYEKNEEIKVFFNLLMNSINIYYKNLLTKLTDTRKTTYFSIIQKTETNKKEILVTTDNHTSLDYFGFLMNKLEDPYSHQYFCGDVIDRSQYYYLNQYINYHTKNSILKTFPANYEKKLFICDFLKSILLLSTKIFVHEANPNVYFEVLGNHEESIMIYQDMNLFLEKLNINSNKLNCNQISQIMKLIIPTQIITVYTDDTVDVFNHSGGGFYLSVNDLKKEKIKNKYFEVIKIFYSTDDMVNLLEINPNNEIYHRIYNDNCTKDKIALLGKKNARQNQYKKIDRNQNIHTWCDFCDFMEQNLDNNITITNPCEGRGIMIKNIQAYITKYLRPIYEKMIEEGFSLDTKKLPYTCYYGHQHSDENLKMLCNQNSGYNELHTKWDEYTNSVFLPPAHIGNAYGFFRLEYLNYHTYKLNKENDLKITFVDHDSKISNFEIKQSHQKLEQEKEQIKKLYEKLERTKKLELAISPLLVSIPSGLSGLLLKEILKDSLPKSISIFDKNFFSTLLSNLKNNREKTLPRLKKIVTSKTFWITLGTISLIYYKSKINQLSTIKEKINQINQK